MGVFHFRLTTLLKMREAERDESRLRLAEALEAERILLAKIEELELERGQVTEQSRVAVQPGVIDLDRLVQASRYEHLLEAQLRVFRDREQQLRTEIGRRRDALLESDRRVKVLEKLRERQLVEFHQRESKKEQQQMDALGLRGRAVR